MTIPLVRVLLEHGAFDAAATGATAGALRFYAPSVLFISVNMLFKILLFVLVDGWHLVCESLVTSFVL